MKTAYPIIMSKGVSHVIAYIPDFNINTQGMNEADAMEMARDAIGLIGIDMQDDNEILPKPSEISAIKKLKNTDIITLVDVNFDEYRKQNYKKGRFYASIRIAQRKSN